MLTLKTLEPLCSRLNLWSSEVSVDLYNKQRIILGLLFMPRDISSCLLIYLLLCCFIGIRVSHDPSLPFSAQ